MGYIFGFLASFLLLLITLYGFGVVTSSATESGIRAELDDIAQRSALLVSKALLTGSHRASATADIDTSKLVMVMTIDVPQVIRGQHYTISLSSAAVTATVPVPGYTEQASTLHIILPACGTDVQRRAASVCEISGSGNPSLGRVQVIFQYDSTTVPVTNRIVLQ